MRHAKEPKKKRYQEPVLTDLGHGPQAREKIIDLAISKGISSQDLNRLLSELGKRKIAGHSQGNKLAQKVISLPKKSPSKSTI